MQMNYFVVGTNDIAAAIAFYNELFTGADLQSFSPSERMHYWIGDGFAFAVALPFDKQPASVGNGTMVGFSVETKAEVERMYLCAIAQGGRCEGAPGQRGPKYSAYMRDLDGNKLCISD